MLSQHYVNVATSTILRILSVSRSTVKAGDLTAQRLLQHRW